ncbi:MAG: hemerythrin domain-containing protein [Halioglobus sp.]|nr:hemerythrin domain-containing protein [Halioglobus sp.]
MHEMMERLYHDHRNLSRLFDMLEEQVARYDRDSTLEPDLLLILDIVSYLNDYPRAYHHPLEEAAIAQINDQEPKKPDINRLISEQHHDLEKATERLSGLFTQVANDYPVPIEEIREALNSYLAQSREHLQAEEDRLFPIMEQVLGDEEWRNITSRLPEHGDPLLDEDPDADFAELKNRL